MFQVPPLDERERELRESIRAQQTQLGSLLKTAEPWVATFRRSQLARSLRGTLLLAGHEVSLAEIDSAFAGEQLAADPSPQHRALSGAILARNFAEELASTGDTPTTAHLQGLHFMSHSSVTVPRPGNAPGRIRRRGSSPSDQNTAAAPILARGAEASSLPALLKVLSLTLLDHEDRLLSGIVAHLNIAHLRPFQQGNRQLARLVHSQLLMGSDSSAQTNLSAEEALATTPEIYDAELRLIGSEGWERTDFRPSRAHPWLRFMLHTHLSQAHSDLSRARAIQRTERELAEALRQSHLPERATQALLTAHLTGSVNRARYLRATQEAGESLTEQTGSRDLTALVRVGLLQARGEKRGRSYIPGDLLSRAATSVGSFSS